MLIVMRYILTNTLEHLLLLLLLVLGLFASIDKCFVTHGY